jgi:hypothetical protein
MGAITPIGVGIKESFENLVKGVTGTVSLGKQTYYDLKCLVGAPMPPSVYTKEFHE